MCTHCMEHGFGDKWYLDLEHFLYKKIYPTPEDQAEAKKARLDHMSHIEWQERHPKYARNPDFQRDFFVKDAAQVVTIEDADRIIDLAAEATKREDTIIATARCLCSLMVRGKMDYRCVFFGVPITLAAEVGYARYPKEGLTEFGGAQWRDIRNDLRKGQKIKLEASEVKEMMHDWDKKGLVHTVVTRGDFPLIEGFCNCERPICMRIRQREETPNCENAFVKGNFVAQIDTKKCNGCRNCMEYCQFGAIYVSKYSDLITIDPQKCFGCGLCRARCKAEAIEMVPRVQIPVTAESM